MNKALSYVFFIPFVILAACGKTERVDTEQVKDALKKREIRKISDAEILEGGLKKGKIISENLIDCINENRSGWKGYRQCLDSSSLNQIDTIKFATRDSGNLTGMEKDLFEAYAYNFTNKQALIPNLQDLKNQKMLYTYPTFHYQNDETYFKHPVDGKRPSSFGIIFIYYDKKQLILNL